MHLSHPRRPTAPSGNLYLVLALTRQRTRVFPQFLFGFALRIDPDLAILSYPEHERVTLILARKHRLIDVSTSVPHIDPL